MKAHDASNRSLQKSSDSLDRHMSASTGSPAVNCREESPTHRSLTPQSGDSSTRVGRSPKRHFEDEHYVHSVSQVQTGLGRVRMRRQSDPGRIASLSPLRYRVKVDREISEDGSGELEEHLKLHPRLAALRSTSECDPPEDMVYTTDFDLECDVGAGRPRTPPGWTAWKRNKRSYSLPMADAVLEIGEAIGAVAINDPASSSASNDLLKLPSPSLPVRRRRSVSIETTGLESIVEETGGISKAQSRRFSTPAVNTLAK